MSQIEIPKQKAKPAVSRIVAAFTSTLSREVDLSKIKEDLVAVVQETMQPTHVSLWLRQTAPSREQITRVLPGTEEK